jgi:bifunctional DNase/RNase
MKESRVLEMFVAGLVMDPASNSPIVILKDNTGETALPIWVGLPEASAIASHLKKIEQLRPMTHDLFVTTIASLNARIVRIVITGLKESTFIASLEIAVGSSMQILDCRPSDGIALAIRADAPIFVAREVLKQAQVAIEEGVPGLSPEEGAQKDKLANIDKEKLSEILADMDPEDFKYKM